MIEYTEEVKDIIEKKYKLRQPVAHVHTFGCQQNVSDGEKVKGVLATLGYGFCDSPENADLVLYNTCAIRENAEEKTFGNIGALKHLKASKDDMVIALCGCMMKQEHIANKIKKSYPQVDLVFGTNSVHNIPKMMYDLFMSNKRIFCTEQDTSEFYENIPVRREQKFKASIPIMTGCNNFCTYCIVPYVRGRERSRKSEDIINEIKLLIDDGYKEVTLLGQNVNSYGLGLDEDINFSQLLRKVNAIDGDFQIKFLSSHPKDATRELIDTIKECEKVCNHLHLPIQSGSDRVLGLMNRRYKVEPYLDLVDYARKSIPEICITTDLIIGFPDEQREDFEQTLELLKRVKYDAIFSFIYSKREGTKAASMVDDIDSQTKSSWFTEMLQLQRVLTKNQYGHYVGRTIRVLVDNEAKRGNGYLTGRTGNNIIVDFIGDVSLVGSYVNIKIKEDLNWSLLGEVQTV